MRNFTYGSVCVAGMTLSTNAATTMPSFDTIVSRSQYDDPSEKVCVSIGSDGDGGDGGDDISTFFVDKV